jgi:hypothetical protein
VERGKNYTHSKVLMWKPKGKKMLGRSRRRWEGNIKKDHEEIG